jgi:hypothetical protein
MGRELEKELLSAEDVAALMGVKETTVWRWCREGNRRQDGANKLLLAFGATSDVRSRRPLAFFRQFLHALFVNKARRSAEASRYPSPTTLRRPSGRESIPYPPTRRRVSYVLRRDKYRTLRQTCSLTSHQSRPQPKRGLHNDYPANRLSSRQVFVRAITVLFRKKLAAASRA